MSEKFSRGEFLRRFLRPAAAEPETSDEPDYLSMLPPEFTDSLLKEEIKKLGHNPEELTRNQMAALVLGAMASQTKKSDSA